MSAIETTSQLLNLLRQKHSQKDGAWIYVEEVPSATGSSYWSGRSFDAVALGCWDSNQRQVIIYEVKASRGDFARELQNPAKRQTAMKLANEFYFVTPHGLVRDDEIPEACGLIVMTKNGAKLRTVKRAQQRHEDRTEIPLAWATALLRHQAKAIEELARSYRYAGKDLTEDDLQVLIREKAPAYVMKEIRDAQLQASKQVQDDVRNRIGELELPIRDALGLDLTAAPGRLNYWQITQALQRRIQHPPMNGVGHMPGQLRRWAAEMDKYLDWAREAKSGDPE